MPKKKERVNWKYMQDLRGDEFNSSALPQNQWPTVREVLQAHNQNSCKKELVDEIINLVIMFLLFFEF